MSFDELEYGNPTQEELLLIKKETYLDVLFPDLCYYSFPSNSSDATVEELNNIVECLSAVKGKLEFENRYKIYDRSLPTYFKELLKRHDKKVEEIDFIVDSIIEDSLPLILKLKYYHQRPRPYQLAHYYKLKLFPYKGLSNHSPSFPSGHSFQAKLLTEVIGNKFPELYSQMQKILDDINYSRLYLGFHYQSDIDAGIFCANEVLKLQEFKSKYNI